MTGASRIGKTYLTQALGHQARMMEYLIIYTKTTRFIKKTKAQQGRGIAFKRTNNAPKGRPSHLRSLWTEEL